MPMTSNTAPVKKKSIKVSRFMGATVVLSISTISVMGMTDERIHEFFL